MRILIVTDAWYPQINGVVTTLNKTGQELELMGHEVCYLTPRDKPTVPMPTYPEIRFALVRPRDVARQIEVTPDSIHIATDGPLGWLA